MDYLLTSNENVVEKAFAGMVTTKTIQAFSVSRDSTHDAFDEIENRDQKTNFLRLILRMRHHHHCL